MSIQTGDKIPAVTLKVMGEKGPQDISSEEIFSGKKVVLFAVPGAFTPGCTLTHLPG
jgi:peroxiredoxin